MKRTVQIELAAIVAVLLALLGISRVRINSGAPALGVRTEATPGVDSGVEPGEAGPQTAEEAPVPGAIPTSRSSTRTKATGTQGSSRDSRSEENPAGTGSGDSETAGPPIHYTDQADDAYGRGDGSPNAERSQREFDILRVDWGPVSYVNEQSPGGYFTSITVAGSARSDGEYISEGQFDPARTPPEGCWLSHFLTPGTTAFANAYCEGRFVGRVQGGPVASTPTTSGGTRLTATFDSRTIPPEFEAARTLHNLAAYTHAPDSVDELESEGDFLVVRWMDYASSAQRYRV